MSPDVQSIILSYLNPNQLLNYPDCTQLKFCYNAFSHPLTMQISKLIISQYTRIIFTGIQIFDDTIFKQSLKYITHATLIRCRGPIHIPNIKKLQLYDCHYNFIITILSKSLQLKNLTIGTFFPLSIESPINCPKLESITVTNNMQDVTPFTKCTRLKSLSLMDCDLSSIHECSNLTTLTLTNNSISDLSPITQCPHIHTLTLIKCQNLNTLVPLNIIILTISKCIQINNLSFILEFPRLKTLTIDVCNQITDVFPTFMHPTLQTLVLTNCFKIWNIEPNWIFDYDYRNEICQLCEQNNLQNITFNNMSHLEYINILSHCHKLQRLTIINCPDITEICSISNCVLLTHLEIIGSPNIKSFSAIRSLSKLKILILTNSCLSNISFVTSLPSLQILKINKTKTLYEPQTFFNSISDLAHLSKLNQLCILDVSNLHHVIELPRLANTLYNLDISGCIKLRNVSSLAKCVNLKRVRALNAPCSVLLEKIVVNGIVEMM